ncbi:hypothetical protein FJ987_16475 [Mesorhizobium sp. CU2]|uniref:hypothetical protein n=1 Tax=unclassified Mesorhizobium TaxID=325217 RepID=UPI0011296F97|nr:MULTISPECIES: hypothetical protein [unclassified Mesorhizobium]TPN82564.1 hypothetical protein FJ988_15525 [Mesorhizobium sp. CU3]TPO12769.1 hypothetical protein FJ987_16475 [Mesorhizobium sp. CU2]
MKKDGSGTRSLRPTQTITPLAERLKIEPETTYSKGQEDAAGAVIAGNSVPTLVCWQHESIPRLAAEIVQSSDIAPDQWGDDDYDSIWILAAADGGRQWTFTLELQRLLTGDRS